ncbi:Hypothetical predicted protein [Cloeon dipterum]|uniref:4Fe-4S ferredoxin-type domain-containing protein n=1 Tax=Cloeon dipterum TaxID=197152 RepID=A0A8S1CAN3_9INSE|nr:Hypothetical predicted protein [Cloeon dipterum]
MLLRGFFLFTLFIIISLNWGTVDSFGCDDCPPPPPDDCFACPPRPNGCELCPVVNSTETAETSKTTKSISVTNK